MNAVVGLNNISPEMIANKAKCAICGFEDHSLFSHIGNAHGLTPEQYEAAHPGARLLSDLGTMIHSQMIAERGAAAGAVSKAYDSMAVFGVGFGKNGRLAKPVMGYEGFTEKDGVPSLDPHYVFQPDPTRDFLLGITAGARIYLVGPTGSGKTTLPEQVAARTGRPFTRIQFHADMERMELTGTWAMVGGEMRFLYSALVLALQKPSMIVFDEFDSGNPGVTAIANAVLEGKPLVIPEKGGERIWPHENCIIVGTGNTKGMGDDTGLYQSTSNQSYATMNRFGMTIPIDYMPSDHEVSLLKRLYSQGPQAMPDTEIVNMVKVAGLIRDAFEGGKIEVVISTRQVIAWGKWASMTASPGRAFKLAFLNATKATDAAVCASLFQRVYATAP